MFSISIFFSQNISIQFAVKMNFDVFFECEYLS